MKFEGNTSHLRSGIPSFKFVCPKMTYDKCEDGKYHRRRHCENPCTSSKSGRMVYLYPEKVFRTCPSVLRGTQEWDSTYKTRATAERSINHFKDSFGLVVKHRMKKLFMQTLFLPELHNLFQLFLLIKYTRINYSKS